MPFPLTDYLLLTNYFFEDVDVTLVENDNVTNVIAETTNIYIMLIAGKSCESCWEQVKAVKAVDLSWSTQPLGPSWLW